MRVAHTERCGDRSVLMRQITTTSKPVLLGRAVGFASLCALELRLRHLFFFASQLWVWSSCSLTAEVRIILSSSRWLWRKKKNKKTKKTRKVIQRGERGRRVCAHTHTHTHADAQAASRWWVVRKSQPCVALHRSLSPSVAAWRTVEWLPERHVHPREYFGVGARCSARPQLGRLRKCH